MTDLPEHVEGQLTLEGDELTHDEVLTRTSATAIRLDLTGYFSDWLDEHEAWPDGAPEGVWTAETFAATLVKEYASAEQLLKDWDLQVDYEITVTDDKGRTARVEFRR